MMGHGKRGKKRKKSAPRKHKMNCSKNTLILERGSPYIQERGGGAVTGDAHIKRQIIRTEEKKKQEGGNIIYVEVPKSRPRRGTVRTSEGWAEAVLVSC